MMAAKFLNLSACLFDSNDAIETTPLFGSYALIGMVTLLLPILAGMCATDLFPYNLAVVMWWFLKTPVCDRLTALYI